MSETPQNPGTTPSPEPGQTPQPNNDAQSGTPAATGEPVAGGVPPQGAPDAAGVPPQQPYGGQPPHPGPPYGAQPGQPGTPPPGQQPYPGTPPGYAPPLRPDEERMWALLGHIGGFVLSIFAPLIVWLVFKERSRFVDAEGKEALNFQITVAIAFVALSVLTPVTFGITGILLVPVFIAWLIFMILAAVESSKGRPYRYPVTLRLVK